MLLEELFFTVTVVFLYKESTSLFLFVWNIFNQIHDTAIKVFTDSVKIFNVQTFSHFIVYVTNRRGSYASLSCKFCLTHPLFTKYSGQMYFYHILTAFAYNITLYYYSICKIRLFVTNLLYYNCLALNIASKSCSVFILQSMYPSRTQLKYDSFGSDFSAISFII